MPVRERERRARVPDQRRNGGRLRSAPKRSRSERAPGGCAPAACCVSFAMTGIVPNYARRVARITSRRPCATRFRVTLPPQRALTRQMQLPTSSATSSAPLRVDGDADRAAARVAVGVEEAGQHVDRRARRLAAGERHEDHLVAAARVAVPRAVLADEHAACERRPAAAPRRRRRGRATRCAGRAHSRARSPSPRGRAAAASTRVSTCCAVVAVGPAVEAAVAHRRHVVGHEVAAELVALVDRGPQRAGFGLPRQAVRIAQAGREDPVRAGRADRPPRSRRGPLPPRCRVSPTLLFEPTVT